MNVVDCTVLEVIDKTNFKKHQLDWLKYDAVFYRVKAISWGNEFETDIFIKAEDDKGQIKKGYVFQQ